VRPRLSEAGRRGRGARRVEHVVSNFVPRYYQVYTVIAQRVREGEWTPERPMPTEQDFSAAFNVSRVTIRKALNMLQEEGLILRQQGRGTFAVPPASRKQGRANMSGLLENVADFEQHTKVRVLSFGKVALADEAARLLECEPGAPALKITRIRSDSQSPFSYTTTYVPEPEADLLSEAALGTQTVSSALDKAGVATVSAEQRLSATAAGVEVAKHLRIDVGAPLISMTRVMRDDSGRPVEVIQALYRPDKYEYRVNLSRDNGDAPRWTVKMDR
jgi:GntR family transcriptional regulator